MKRNPKIWLLLFCLSLIGFFANAQNLSLDFDGNGDFISTQMPLGNNSFTAEMWFLSAHNSTSQDCTNNFRNLFALVGAQKTRLEIGICGGTMNIAWKESNGTTQETIPLSVVNFNTFDWHHFALVRINQSLHVYIDCIEIWTGTISSNFNFGRFRLGDDFTFFSNTPSWQGRIDDVRLWGVPRPISLIEGEKNCILNGDEPRLLCYWNFDEGIENGDNSNILFIPDASIAGRKGYVKGFDFLPSSNTAFGTMSNYASSEIPMAYPNLSDLELNIRDYPYQNDTLSLICSGDPVHFSLFTDSLNAADLSNVTVEWFYIEDNQQITLPSNPFSGFKFAVPRDVILADCTYSTTGLSERTFFAVSSINTPLGNNNCGYKSDDYLLQICCPITEATIAIEPSNSFCQGDTSTVTVQLNSDDLFIQTPSENVQIQWFLNGDLLNYDNQSNFNYTVQIPSTFDPQQEICFDAVVSNCCGKTKTFSECLVIEAQPICGNITAEPINLQLIDSTATLLVYEICEGLDAVLKTKLGDYQYCKPQWEYSFDLENWTDLGRTNAVQNTNVLPAEEWPDPTATAIFYRINGPTATESSACFACQSNLIEIRIAPHTDTIGIDGIFAFCESFNNTLTITNPMPNQNYTWFCDNVEVATGTSYTYYAEESKNFRVSTVDNCLIATNQEFKVEYCNITALLSCPIPSNDCACLGEPITLGALGVSKCENTAYSYQWTIDGVVQGNDTQFIIHTPKVSGSLYQVEILDVVNGCLDDADIFVKPCDKE